VSPRREAAASAAAFLPPRPSLAALRRAASDCRGCALYARATQTVFGAGPARARLVLVGEQPGNEEDLAGKPFVGPAGRLLDEALAAAGLARGDCYVTNAVKHFKWEPRGKRRLHSKPNAAELRACRPWLDAELQQLQPQVTVCLGATAAQALLGAAVRVTAQHGQAQQLQGIGTVVATIHPSSVLRQRTAKERAQAYAMLVADLKVVAALLKPA